MSNELTHNIIGAAIEVHKQLGPGLLESIYEEALFYEMQSNGLKVVQQKSFPIIYKGNLLSTKYRCDLLVNDQVIVELKAVDTVSNLHKAQLLTYLKLANLRFGLLMNFNVPVMKNGIVRLLNG